MGEDLNQRPGKIYPVTAVSRLFQLQRRIYAIQCFLFPAAGLDGQYYLISGTGYVQAMLKRIGASSTCPTCSGKVLYSAQASKASDERIPREWEGIPLNLRLAV